MYSRLFLIFDLTVSTKILKNTLCRKFFAERNCSTWRFSATKFCSDNKNNMKIQRNHEKLPKNNLTEKHFFYECSNKLRTAQNLLLFCCQWKQYWEYFPWNIFSRGRSLNDLKFVTENPKYISDYSRTLIYTD